MTHSAERLVFEKVKIGPNGTPGAISVAKDCPAIGTTFSDCFDEECELITMEGLLASSSWFLSKLSQFLRAETCDSSAKHIHSELE